MQELNIKTQNTLIPVTDCDCADCACPNHINVTYQKYLKGNSKVTYTVVYAN